MPHHTAAQRTTPHHTTPFRSTSQPYTPSQPQGLFLVDEHQRVRLAVERLGLNSVVPFKPEVKRRTFSHLIQPYLIRSLPSPPHPILPYPTLISSWLNPLQSITYHPTAAHHIPSHPIPCVAIPSYRIPSYRIPPLAIPSYLYPLISLPIPSHSTLPSSAQLDLYLIPPRPISPDSAHPRDCFSYPVPTSRSHMMDPVNSIRCA